MEPLFELFLSPGNEEILDGSGSFRTLIDPNRRKLIRRAKMKSLRISVAIVCVFLVCWTPYYVAMIIYLFSEDKYKILMVRKIILILNLS
jgi:hypothetical protein